MTGRHGGRAGRQADREERRTSAHLRRGAKTGGADLHRKNNKNAAQLLCYRPRARALKKKGS
jgi:hypothetical protein